MLRSIFAAVLLSSLLTAFIPTVNAQVSDTRNITFPVVGNVSYSNDFGASRDGGARTHEGNDIMGAKMMPLVAVVSGKVRSVVYPEASYGYAITLQDSNGYTYHYLHINNDVPGTDNGKGDGMNAYGPDVVVGQSVVAGQFIGYMGDSGNAESTQAHVHFEIRNSDRSPINPYPSLKAATKITALADYPKQSGELLPFGNFTGGSFISMGNVDSDKAAEIVVAAGPGGGPHVQVLEQNGTVKANFFPYDIAFTGGVDVVLADINDDGKDEIVTAPKTNGGPHIKIFDLTGKELYGFMAYDQGFTGGVNIAAADVDDDGEEEIITAPGVGGGPHVRVFKANGTQVSGFFAYDANFTFGIDVAAFVSRKNVYIATVPGMGSSAHVKVFDKDGDLRDSFMAYDTAHIGGARIAMAEMNRTRDPEIITVPLLGGAQVRTFSITGKKLQEGRAYESWWTGSWDIAAYGADVFISIGPQSKRRVSIREVDFSTRTTRSTRNR